MKHYRKIVLFLLLASGMFIGLPAGFDFFWNRSQRVRLQQLQAGIDSIIIRGAATETCPEVKLTGEELNEFWAIFKLKRPLIFHFCECPGGLSIHFFKNNHEQQRISCFHALWIRGLDPSFEGEFYLDNEYAEKLRQFLIRHQIPSCELD